MQKKCTICGGMFNNWVVEPGHQDKPVCLNCVNGLILNLNTIEKELSPLVDSLSNGVTAVKERLDKHKL